MERVSEPSYVLSRLTRSFYLSGPCLRGCEVIHREYTYRDTYYAHIVIVYRGVARAYPERMYLGETAEDR